MAMSNRNIDSFVLSVLSDIAPKSGFSSVTIVDVSEADLVPGLYFNGFLRLHSKAVFKRSVCGI